MELLTTDLPSQFNVEVVSPFSVMIRPAGAEADMTTVPVPAARELVREHHLLIFRGFGAWSGPEELARYAASWGQIFTWSFGAVLELVEHERPADHVFDNTGVSFSLGWHVVVADNYTLLYGREPYASRCGRHLRRVHVLGDPPLINPALLSQF